MTAAVAVLPTLSSCLASFLRIELVRSSLLMRSLSAFTACFPRFFRVKLMRRAFFVRSFPALAGYLPLLVFIHRSETAIAATAFAAAIFIVIRSHVAS
jgi:hypothetical protein